MGEYLPNSRKYKEERRSEEKKLEKVVKGKVKVRKKSELSKLADAFVLEDASKVVNHIATDVLIPSMKKILYDMITDGIDMFLFGGTGGAKRRSNADRVSYNNYYDRNRSSEGHRSYGSVRKTFDDIILDSRVEAEDVLERMDELIGMYGVVSIADLNELVGITGQYTDNKYGWTSLRSADIVRLNGGGYLLKLPRAMPID